MPQTALEVGGLSDIGMVRSRNEDSMGNWVPEPSIYESRGHLFIVADGMGGHAAGNVASKMAVELSTRTYYYSPYSQNPGENLEYAIKVGNREIYDEAQRNPDYHRMGTTFVGFVAYGDEAYVANVGDSRAYLVRKSSISQVTKDHSWVALQVEMGEITQEEAESSQNRSILLRCLGEKPDVLVDSQIIKLELGDIFILCSDGLHGLVSNEEIRLRVEEMESQTACQSLVDLANSRGGHDNITVVVVKVKEVHPAAVPPPPRNHDKIVVESSTLPARPGGIGTSTATARATATTPSAVNGVAKAATEKAAGSPAEVVTNVAVAADKQRLGVSLLMGAVLGLALYGWWYNGLVNHDSGDGPAISMISSASMTPLPSASLDAHSPAAGPSASASASAEGTSMSVRSNPPGAHIKVDGEDKGVTPFTANLPVGGHVIDVQDDQGHKAHREVSLSAGFPSEITIDLLAPPSSP